MTSPVTTPKALVGVGGVGNLTGITDIAAGGTNTYAVAGGHIYAWGANNEGQLGIGSGNPSYTDSPVEVGTPGNYLSTVVSLSASNSWAMALTQSGKVYDWGGTPNGTAYTPIEVSFTPTEITGLTNIVRIVAGTQDGLALNASGNVWCWGRDTDGQCGALGEYNPTAYTMYPPQEIPNTGGYGTYISGVTDMTEGNDFSVLVQSGNVYTLGQNVDRQLGVAGTASYYNTPQKVIGASGSGYLSTVTSVAANNHTVIAISGGNVYGWGLNTDGQTGNSSATSYVPYEVLGVGGTGHLSGITAIAEGNNDSYAMGNNTVYAWGANTQSQLIGSSASSSSTPVAIAGWTSLQTLTAGGQQISVLN